MSMNAGAASGRGRIAAWKTAVGAENAFTFAAIAICTCESALFRIFPPSADLVAYQDLSDAIRAHQWHAVVNAYWFPLYPALLTLGKALFGASVRYELAAARLVDAILQLLFIASAIFLAISIQQLFS